MPIERNDMLPISLPAYAWDWIMEILPQLSVPMQPRDQIVGMMQGQMKQHLARAASADAAAVASPQPAVQPELPSEGSPLSEVPPQRVRMRRNNA